MARFNARWPQARAVLTLGAAVAYVLAFVPLHPYQGTWVAAVAVLVLLGAAVGRMSHLDEQLKTANERLRSEITQRKQVEGSEREQHALAEVLRDAATVLNSTPNFDEVLDRIIVNVDRAVPHDAANIMLIRSGVAHVVRSHSHAERRLEALPLSLQVPLDDVSSYLYQMAETGQPLVIPDTQAHPGWVDLTETHRVRSYLGAPIRPKGQVIGFLSLNSVTPGFFTPSHTERLQAFADQAGIAIENARLYDALGRYADVLEQRVAERTRELSEANARLKQLDRLKDEFLASMSHELRTPLNAILGLSEALQEQVYGPLNANQLKSLHSIEESGRHLLSLITDILDLSKIGAGKMELEIGPVSVVSVCQASLRFIKEAVHQKQLKVSSTLDSTVTILHADERRLKQILVNLLSNAVKFTPDGGTIGLKVVGDLGRRKVHFIVWDTGIGISSEDIGRLFQPFVQLDSSLSRRHPGSGLGLVLVHRMTQLHGGSVAVESEVEKGSRFTVSLPWRGPSDIAFPVDESEAVESNLSIPVLDLDFKTEQPLILLAEDNETSSDALSDYLSVKGYRVIVARNGSEAIERARSKKPDVILMDVQMPGMDGLEATRRLRMDADLATTPIIALTALAMPGDREQCLAAGANAYLSKPVNLQGLIGAIEAQRSSPRLLVGLNRNRIEEETST